MSYQKTLLLFFSIIALLAALTACGSPSEVKYDQLALSHQALLSTTGVPISDTFEIPAGTFDLP